MAKLKLIAILLSIGIVCSGYSIGLINDTLNNTSNKSNGNLTDDMSFIKNMNISIPMNKSASTNKFVNSNISDKLSNITNIIINNTDNIKRNLISKNNLNNSNNYTELNKSTIYSRYNNIIIINNTLKNISLKNIPNYNNIKTLKKNNKHDIYNTTDDTKSINIDGINNTSINNYLNITINGYKVIVKTNGEPFGYAKHMKLKFMKVNNNEYILSPVILNTPMEIYSKFKKNEILHKTVFLNHSDEEDKETHYLNISYNTCKLIIYTNGEPYAKYENLSVNVNFKKFDDNTYMAYPLLLNNTLNVYSKFDNETLNKKVFLNYILSKPTIQKNILVKDIYSPKESVYIKLNFVPKIAYLITPTGKRAHLKLKKEGDYYILTTTFKKDITIGNYTLVVDNCSKIITVDYYKINAKYVNNSIVGNVGYYVKSPNYLRYVIYPSGKNGTVKLVNGTFDIPINTTELSKVNKVIKVILICNDYKKELKIKVKPNKVKKTISYDLVSGEIVVKLEGDTNAVKEHIKEFKGFKCEKEINLNNFSLCELRIKASEGIVKEYGLPEEILKTTETVKKISDDKIRVEVSNKLDNVWYRFSAKIPNGYRVKEIVGDDGRVIKNNISINRATGEVSGELRWYVENGILYFYDDPILGYDITLSHPAPNNSIAVELAYKDEYGGKCGQISAIVFPYSEGDSDTTIATYDHAGRTYDGGYGNNIDADAGSKIAIKYAPSLYWSIGQYGNGGDYYETAPDYLSEISKNDIRANSIPSGLLEDVIVSKMYAPWKNYELNITQKVIIRGNHKWFATVYYITNPTSNTYSNLKFFQGMDWNFKGSYSNDNAYYDTIDDIVYGYDADASTDGIQYGGFKSILPSYEHDVNWYGGMWNDIKDDSLNNNPSYTGDAGTALSWTKSSLNSNEVWVIPIIWGLGYNYSDMLNEVNKGLNQLYDAGVKDINYPNNEDSFNPNIQPIIYVNSTIALYGIVDAYNLNVSINMSQIGGTYSYSNSTLINLSVPYEEEKLVSFPIDISSMPYGEYNITVKTNLPNDQNTLNDQKSITIYLISFSIEPSSQNKVGNAGDEVFYNITAYNNGTGSNFDISIDNSTKGWTTRVYDGVNVIAEDTDGDGVWDYIASGYDSNSNNMPDLYIPVGETNITISKIIPSTTPLGEIDLTTLDFVGINNPSVEDSASFQTSTPYPPSVHKTFYLHGDESRTLNTSIPTKIVNYTEIYGNSLKSWIQSPRFAEDFTVIGNIPILLYMNDADGADTHNIVVSLIATDGSNAFTLGSDEEVVSLDSTVNPYIFNISLDSITAVPKNYYLVLRVENQQSTNSINIYHDSTRASNITMNTKTYVKVYSVDSDKSTYRSGENATISANITDPIGSYDISGANITVYYPNGTTYIEDSMNLNEIDSDSPSLWSLYNYSFNFPVSGRYNITITGIESNGVVYKQNYSVNVTPNIIEGVIYEDFGVIGLNDSYDKPIPNVSVALIKDADENGILDINDSCIGLTTTDSEGKFNFTVVNSGFFFVAVNSKTVNTIRGLNTGYSINDIWAEETYQTEWNGTDWTIVEKFGGQDPEKSDRFGILFFDSFENWEGWTNYRSGAVEQSSTYSHSGSYSLRKYSHNDPSGGYKEIGKEIGRNIVMEGWIYRPTPYDGGKIDRIGIEDDNYNGYSIKIHHNSNYISIDKRTGGSATEISSRITWNPPENEWYKYKLYLYSNGTLKLEVYYENGSLGVSISTTDTTYTKFDRVVIHGGYDYYVDDLTVKDLNQNYEHYIIINSSKYNGENISFGFSSDTIVNTLDNSNNDIQGSFRQFIKNANAINGGDISYFNIPTTDPNYNGGIYTITLNASDMETIKDSNTAIDGSTQTTGTIRLNGTDNGTYYVIIPTIAQNTTVSNLQLVNYKRGIEATHDGCDGLKIINVSFIGNNAGDSIYLEDTEWDFQDYPTEIYNISINSTNATSEPFGIDLINRIWLNLQNSSIHVENGSGIYWANWAENYANLTIKNIVLNDNNFGIWFYYKGNNVTIVNVTVKNSIYEGISLSNSGDIAIINSTSINNSIGAYINNCNNISLYNDTISNNKYEGIQGYNSTICINKDIIKNQIQGIFLENTLSNILNTLVEDNQYEGIVSQYSKISIYNTSTINNFYGIYILSKKSTKIVNSSIVDNDYGIGIINSSNIIVNNSNISLNNISGMYIGNGNNISLSSLMFYNNNGTGILSYGNATNIIVCNSSFEYNGNTYIGNDIDYGGMDIQVPNSSSIENISILFNSFNKNGHANVSDTGFGIHIYSEGISNNYNISNNFINSSWRDGLYVFGVNNLTIINNNMTNNGLVGGDPAGSGLTVSGYNNENVSIENNTILYNGGNGINLEGPWGYYLSNVLVVNNLISNNGIDANAGNGLYLGGRVENATIKNNVIQYSDAQAILIQEPSGWDIWDYIGTNISIINNTIQYNGLTIESGNTTASITIGAYGNYDQDDGYILIKNNSIINNNICPNSNYTGKMGGIEVYGLNEGWINLELNISNNIIANHSAYGISIGASKDINIINNTIYNNEQGITIPSWDFVPYDIIISKNNIFNNSMIGIDLNDDNITLNDGLINPSQPNYGIDYPIITTANLKNDNLTIKGYIGDETGSSNFAYATVEIYLVKNSSDGDNLIGNNVSSDGSILSNKYGEGWTYLGTIIADEDGNFNGTINVSGKGVDDGSIITATTTINGRGTSEFGRNYVMIKRFFNIIGTIIMLSDGYNISVKSYNNTQNVYAYWYKPDNIGVINISGDYDENGTNGNTYWFKFNTLNANETKNITIKTNISTIEGLIIGIDPK